MARLALIAVRRWFWLLVVTALLSLPLALAGVIDPDYDFNRPPSATPLPLH